MLSLKMFLNLPEIYSGDPSHREQPKPLKTAAQRRYIMVSKEKLSFLKKIQTE